MKTYSTNPDSIFFLGEALRSEREALPVADQVRCVFATLAEQLPGSIGADLAYRIELGRGRYRAHDGRAFTFHCWRTIYERIW